VCNAGVCVCLRLLLSLLQQKRQHQKLNFFTLLLLLLPWLPGLRPACFRSDSEFFEDEELDQDFRASLADFRGSGYDRGHLAPAADHRRSQREMDETFVLSNVSPQVGDGFNR